MSDLTSEMQAFHDLDKRLVEAAKRIKVLTFLNWPEDLADIFLEQWKRGNPAIPVVNVQKTDFSQDIAKLQKIMAECDVSHPVGGFLHRTAESYAIAAEMLDNRGKPGFTDLSIRLYGKPSDPISPAGLTHLDAADYFLEVTRDFVDAHPLTPEEEFCVPAQQVAEQLRERLVPFFSHHKVEILLDPQLTSKAVAGSQRVRLRTETCFSKNDPHQLLHHEGFVHMLTALNGRSQPHLQSMGLGAPRTTRTQEGLATFAELITGSMDLPRLRRLALRIRAVHMALEGADFMQVFRYFVGAGQEDHEAFHSTARVFRGGDPKGGIVFTKDVVYLQGLILVHTFLRKCAQANKFIYAEHLFAGRITLGDVVELEPFYQSGFIRPPLYEPPWLTRRQNLAAYLCYAVFANKVALGDFTLEDFALRKI